MASAFGAFDVLRGERGFVREEEASSDRESRRRKKRHREKTRRDADVRPRGRLPGRVVRRVSDGTRRTLRRVVTQFGFRHFVSHLTFATCWYSRASRVDTPCVAPPAGFAALVVPTSASPPGCHAPRRARRFRIARRRASSRGTDAACVPLGTRPIGSPDPRRFESASVARRP